MKVLNKKVASVVTAVAAVSVGAVVAYGYYTASGSGNGTADAGTSTPWTVNGFSSSGTMLPGSGTATVSFTITNASSGHQAITGVSASIPASSGNVLDSAGTAVPGCLASWFSAGSATVNGSAVSTPVDLAGAATAAGTVAVTMTNAAVSQDACKGVSPRVTVSVS